MAECRYCGGEIVFRHDGGRVVPIRITCRCGESGGQTSICLEQKSECLLTKCPECKAPVFFVRHNGGSVWLDDLCPPWPQHRCVRTEKPSKETFEDYALPNPPPGCLIPLKHQVCKIMGGSRVRVHTFGKHAGVKHESPLCLVFEESQAPESLSGVVWFCSLKDQLLFGPMQRVLRYVERWYSCRSCGIPYPEDQIAPHEAKCQRRRRYAL